MRRIIGKEEREIAFPAIRAYFGNTFKLTEESDSTVLFEVVGNGWSAQDKDILLIKLDSFICGVLWFEGSEPCPAL